MLFQFNPPFISYLLRYASGLAAGNVAGELRLDLCQISQITSIRVEYTIATVVELVPAEKIPDSESILIEYNIQHIYT